MRTGFSIVTLRLNDGHSMPALKSSLLGREAAVEWPAATLVVGLVIESSFFLSAVGAW
jgi:hypothetical protein